jgi:peptidyl-prolyl cis-trans isomerase SurA
MEKKIWKPVQNDSVSLKKYYDLNRDKFISPTSLDGFIVSGSDKATIKEIKEAIGQDSLASVKKQFPNSIFRTLEKTDKKSSFLPYELMLELENPKIYKHNGQFICVYITKVYPSMVMEFSNIKGKVIDQLQKDKEEEWIAELKSEYNINVNYDLIQKINQSLEK